MHKIAAVAALAASLAFFLAVPAFAAETNKDAVAVIIGNKDYAGPVPDVDFAHNDADAITLPVGGSFMARWSHRRDLDSSL